MSPVIKRVLLFVASGTALAGGANRRHHIPFQVSLKASDGPQQKDIRFVCEGNSCRSAGMFLSSVVLRQCFPDEFNIKVDINSFGRDHAAQHVGHAAEPVLTNILQDSAEQEKYLEFVSQELGKLKKTEFKITQDHRTCFREKMEVACQKFEVKTRSVDLMRNAQIYVPTIKIQEQLREDLEREEYQELQKKELPEIGLMSREGKDIDDIPWASKLMLETYVLRLLLKSFPEKGEIAKIFESDLIQNKEQLYTYTEGENWVPYDPETHGAYDALTADKIGFYYNFLEQSIFDPLKEKGAEFELLEYDGPNPPTQAYDKKVFPKVGFFNMDKVISYFEENGKAKEAKDIVHLKNACPIKRYRNLAQTLFQEATRLLLSHTSTPRSNKRKALDGDYSEPKAKFFRSNSSQA